MPEASEINTSFLIADLAGYTALTEIHGGFSASDLIHRYIELVEDSIKKDTRLVERIGDEVLITSDSIGGLIDTSLTLLNTIENEPHFPSVHMGLHSGLVIKRDGKYYGHTLNLTSRICSYARAGQILCSQEIVDTVKNSGKYSFLKLGNIQFKNVTDPLAVFEIVVDSKRESISFDPVCKMQIDINKSPAKLVYDGNTYFFCSYRCLKKIIKNPSIFI